MYRTGLMPPRLAMPGVIGGSADLPLVDRGPVRRRRTGPACTPSSRSPGCLRGGVRDLPDRQGLQAVADPRPTVGHAQSGRLGSPAPWRPGRARLRRRDSATARSRTIRSMEGRETAVSLAGGRIAIGAASLLAPGLVGGSRMTGRDGSEGATRLFRQHGWCARPRPGSRAPDPRAASAAAPARGWLEASAVVGTESTRPRAPSRATTFVRACLQAQLAWRPRARCSAPGWRAGPTWRRSSTT